jgi:hypothetical protein
MQRGASTIILRIHLRTVVQYQLFDLASELITEIERIRSSVQWVPSPVSDPRHSVGWHQLRARVVVE